MEHFPHRKLKTVSSSDITHDGKASAIWTPVSPLNIFKDFAWRCARKRYASQCTAVNIWIAHMTAERDGQLARRRDRKKLSSEKPEWARFRALRIRRENLGRIPI